MKTILITGSSGFIGTSLMEKLRGRYRIIPFDKKDGFDIFDSGLDNFVKMADVVVHLAAIIDVQHSFRHPKETFNTNVLGTALVAAACIKNKKKLVYTSSAAVKEPSSSPYAKSKYLAEEIVANVPRACILRLYNVYPGKSVISKFLKNKQIVVNGDGTQSRDFINVEDVVSIIGESFKWSGLIEVGTGKAITINEVADIVSDVTGKDIVFRDGVKEVYESKANVKKLKLLYKKRLRTNLNKDILKIYENGL